MCELYIYIFLGLTIGYVGGYAGIGGGPFLVSFLVLICGFSQLESQGNVLTMMLGPMSLLGVVSLYDYVKQQWLNIAIGVISYCTFSYIGAVVAFLIGEQDIKLLFALILILIAFIQIVPILRGKTYNSIKYRDSISWLWILILGALTGTVGGLFGIGAGVLMVPVLIGIFKLKKEFARALSLAILVPPVSYGAYIKYNLEITIDWNLVLILFFSYFVANYFGAKAGTEASNKHFKITYSLVLVGIAIVYLF
ncbi:sulfite exporter TauE/SafE family protein [Winogradskyella alexanderae]|uniref:Probable membrane transporter protein n=1 Tax=Winogradskyella alexanderae TaxID=2877123 RepID=A0ABS7XUS3_9FLAO|nr:sulfite exporter TauE/SafE family protein [Winogradskyella alexanderae]MCA0133771.1 sulfite exporter TauE/SafE family protein [Winogradskyella alexanderae]